MHVLLISSWYPSKVDVFNGDFVQRHAEAVALHHKVSVVHAEGIYGIDKWEHTIDYRRENMTEYIYYFPKSRLSILNFFRKIIAYSKGLKQIAPVDIIHANVVHYHFLWLLWQGLPYVISEHSTQYLRFANSPHYWLKKIIFRPIFSKAKAVLPVSQSLGDFLALYFGKLNIQIVPNVVDIDKFLPAKNKNEVFTFLHLSNLSAAKNVVGMLEATKILVQQGYKFRFRIGGNGDSRFIEDYVVQNRLEQLVEIIPSLTHNEVAQAMQQANCFVLFSHFENQPCVIVEAFASGLPVIATDVGGVKEFFPSDFGTIIPRGNIDKLVAAMQEIIAAKRIAAPDEMQVYAQTNFSVEAISLKISKIYNDCLTQG